MKKAVGYVRTRGRTGKLTHDVALQKNAIRQYAESNRYQLLKIFWEPQTLAAHFYRKRKRKPFHGLADALALCQAEGADFFYVDLGPWRYSAAFFLFLDGIKRSKGQKRVRTIAIKDRATIEAIQRQARFEKNISARGLAVKRRSPEDQQAINEAARPVLGWKRRQGIGTKRFRNFEHLYDGVESIYQKFRENRDASDRELGDILHFNRYLTVDGRQWTKDNVRKARRLMETKEFQEFVALCEAEKKATD